METNWLANDVYAIRDHEAAQLLTENPNEGRYIAVMARTVELPPGEHSKERSADGAPVEQATIVAAEFGAKHQCWHWIRLSAPTKEFVGDLLFNGGCERDRWYYLQITDLHLAK